MAVGTFAVGTASLALGGLALCWLGIAAWRRDRERGGAALSAFAGLLGGGALVLSALAASEGPATLRGGTAAPWFRLLLVVSLLETIPWSVFALQYTGRDRELGLDGWGMALASGPILVLVGLVVAPVDAGAALAGPSDPLGMAVLTAAVGVGTYWIVAHLLGTVTLLRGSYVHDHVPATQGGALALASLHPVVTVSVLVGLRTGTPPAGVTVGVVALGFLATGVGVGLALFLDDGLAPAPAPGTIGRAVLFDEIEEPVVVADADGRVLEANGAARRQLDDPDGTLESVLGVDLPALRSAEKVAVPTVDGRRLFDPEVAVVPDARGDRLGHAVLLRDVTEREIRQQRLEVLNRVVRHNLRNKLTVVKGVADIAVDGGQPPEQLARDLSEAAEELMTIGEKAREVEELMHGGPDPTVVDLRRVVADAAKDVRREYRGASIRPAVPRDATARTDEDLLRCAISNVLEVAVEHADGEGVDVGLEGRGIVVECERVPDHERLVIEEGEETPLDHASGLGLWAANWCLTRIGGELDFEDADSVARIRVELPANAFEDADADGTAVADGG